MNEEWLIAYKNVKQFIKDCEVEMYIKECQMVVRNGYYYFELQAKDFDYYIDLGMPSLPLEELRYMEVGKQDAWRFKRLEVDGSTWLWVFALVTKEKIKEDFISSIRTWQGFIEKKEQQLRKLNE